MAEIVINKFKLMLNIDNEFDKFNKFINSLIVDNTLHFVKLGSKYFIPTKYGFDLEYKVVQKDKIIEVSILFKTKTLPGTLLFEVLKKNFKFASIEYSYHNFLGGFVGYYDEKQQNIIVLENDKIDYYKKVYEFGFMNKEEVIERFKELVFSNNN